MNQYIVHEWYNNQKNVNDMAQWNKGKLKLWEQKVLEYFPEKARILDIGCGKGREAFALSDKGFSVVGIDISEIIINEVTQISKELFYDIPFLLYDGHRLPFEDNSFDVIIIWSQTFGLLYGHSYKTDFLKECYRVLKNGGILSYSGHDYEYLTKTYLQYTNDRKFYPYENSEIYWESFIQDELAAYALDAGFKIIACEQGEIYRPEDGVILHCICRKG